MVMHAWFAAAILVSGLVTADHTPLPGCTVSLESRSYSAVKISGADGKYAFAGVPAGTYDLKFHLDIIQAEVGLIGKSEYDPERQLDIVDSEMVAINNLLRTINSDILMMVRGEQAKRSLNS